MNFLISLIPTVLVLGVVILVHELGHFLACRLTGVRVEKFSIGFGPEIFHWQGKETRYAVSAIPFGGFIKPAGEVISEVGEEGPKQGDYLASPLPVRIFIVCAGVLMNYILAYVLFVAIFMMGRPVTGTKIAGFMENSPAAVSGLQKGDRVIQVAQTPVENWGEMTEAIQSAPDEEIELLVERPVSEGRAELLAVVLRPMVEELKNPFGEKVVLKRIGVMADPEASHFERYGFWEALVFAAKTEAFLTVMTHKAIFYLLLGKMSLNNIAGPVGIVAMTGDAAKLGFPYVVQLTATLSVSLAVINLLPIPALDGGHLLFLLIEAIRRRKVSLQIQERFNQAGFTLLIVLMLFVIYNDLINLDVVNKIMNLFGGK